MHSFQLIVFVTFSFLHSTKTAIPKYVNRCYRNDPKINNCITNSIEKLRPHLQKGIPELNVPTLEPLEIKGPASIPFGNINGPKTNITNIKIYGGSNFTILDLKADVTKNYYKFRVLCPFLFVDSTYQIDTQILFLRIKGEGAARINTTNLTFECILQGKKIKKDLEEHLHFNQMQCTATLGETKVNLENLFGENVLLGEITNRVINDNVDIFLKEVEPVIINAATARFTQISNNIANTLPYNELFL